MINKDEVLQLAKRLFPINRSLTGNGVIKTLNILNEISAINIVSFNSGKKVFDWVVPEEWNVECAYIEDRYGNKIVDFDNCNLHLVGYSIPFSGIIKKEELQKHIYTLPDRPEWIPYVTSYYRKIWGFCMAHNEFEKLSDQEYFVNINSSFKMGKMHVGEIYIKGETKKEILISCNICHPSMANNEISGMIVAIYLAKIIKNINNIYSYRFVFAPETIGVIAYISKYLKVLKKNVIAGFQLTCIGDRGPMSYLMAKDDGCISNRIAINILKYTQGDVKVHSFLERGSDERQYCSPGIDLPVGSLMRTRYDTYPEYHTSADNLDFLSADSLVDSINKCLEIIKAIEKNQKYVCTKKCEPHLSKYNLYPYLSTKDSIKQVRTTKNILTYCDGKTSLLEIAEKLNVPMYELYKTLDLFIEKGLVTFKI